MFVKENDNKKAVLYVYPGLKGLPSIEPSCCQLMLLVNYYKLNDVQIKHHNWYPTIKVPCLIVGKNCYYDVQQIAQKLKQLSKNKDDDNEIAEEEEENEKKLYPYTHYINNSLQKPVYMHLYGDPLNRQHTMSVLKKSYYFPFSMIFAKKMVGNIESTLFFYEESRAGVNWEIVGECLQGFENTLIKSSFLLEKRSEVDCYLVGCLAPVLLAKHSSSDLKQRLDQQKHVCEYVTNYISKYSKHPNEANQLELNKYNVDEGKEDESAGAPTIVLATLFAGTAMILFGMFNGII